ncbi:MAG: WXG100 family type VII secretion target [Microbacteriaceae bacterium]
MSETIETDPASIRRMNDALVAAASDMSTELSDLTNELNFLMTLWTGEASIAYQTAQTGWTSSMTSINGILNQVTGLLEGIAVRYEETETSVIALCE